MGWGGVGGVRAGEKQFFQRRLALGGMFGIAPVASIWRRIASVS